MACGLRWTCIVDVNKAGSIVGMAAQLASVAGGDLESVCWERCSAEFVLKCGVDAIAGAWVMHLEEALTYDKVECVGASSEGIARGARELASVQSVEITIKSDHGEYWLFAVYARAKLSWMLGTFRRRVVGEANITARGRIAASIHDAPAFQIVLSLGYPLIRCYQLRLHPGRL